MSLEQLERRGTDHPLPKLLGSGDGGPPAPPDVPNWKHRLTEYKNDLRAIRFPSLEALFVAIDLFWVAPELQGAPRMSVGGTTLFVPSEAAEILESKGLSFRDEPIAHSTQFTARQLNALRKKSVMTSGGR